jgi:hypothetical protein
MLAMPCLSRLLRLGRILRSPMDTPSGDESEARGCRGTRYDCRGRGCVGMWDGSDRIYSQFATLAMICELVSATSPGLPRSMRYLQRHTNTASTLYGKPLCCVTCDHLQSETPVKLRNNPKHATSTKIPYNPAKQPCFPSTNRLFQKPLIFRGRVLSYSTARPRV